MTQEEKELVIKDLCARLPYGVICYGVTKDTDEDDNYIDKEVTDILYELHSYKCCYGLVGLMNECNIESIKPYLRPMSSMTEEEKNKLKEYLDAAEVDCNGFGYSEGGTLEDYISSIPYSICVCVVDWLNKNMFDYRGFIPKGLAIEAPEGMYEHKTKTEK